MVKILGTPLYVTFERKCTIEAQGEGSDGLKIAVADYVGHPFQAQLSRALARSGATVRHYHSELFSGPKGALRHLPEDPATLRFQTLGSVVPNKESMGSRVRAAWDFGRVLKAEIRDFEPDIVLASNVPPEALVATGWGRGKTRWVWWVQDLFGVAAKRILRKKSRLLAMIGGVVYGVLERRIAKGSDAIVVITNSFTKMLPPSVLPNTTVIHNWAPLDELSQSPRSNPWGAEYDLTSTFNFVYTGTLGMKHSPELLLELAEGLRDNPDAVVTLVSEGAGADFIRRASEERGLTNLRVLGFQPYERLADVMGTADVLLVLLEHDAGAFSVPSKVLSYLCAGRAILGAIPRENLAAEVLIESGAGRVVAAGDGPAFARAGIALAEEDADTILEMGRAGRAHAEEYFDIDKICRDFLSVLSPNGAADPGAQGG